MISALHLLLWNLMQSHFPFQMETSVTGELTLQGFGVVNTHSHDSLVVCEANRLKHLGVLGVWERSRVSVVDGPSLFWSRLVPPCSSDFNECLAEGSRPDIKSMLCFRLSSLSYWRNRTFVVLKNKKQIERQRGKNEVVLTLLYLML